MRHFFLWLSNETVEKGQFWDFYRKTSLENKGVMGSGFLGFRVFLQPLRLGAAAEVSLEDAPGQYSWKCSDVS